MNLHQIMKIRQSSRMMVQELGFLENRFAKIGSYSLCHALLEIKRHQYLTSTQLSQLLNLEKSTISRLVKNLELKGYCKIQDDSEDYRTKLISLSTKGEEAVQTIDNMANQQVSDALSKLNPTECEQVIAGLRLYAKALKFSRIQAEYSIRKLKKTDIPKFIEITKKVWAEFGFDSQHPHAEVYEQELHNLADNCFEKTSHYYVVTSKKTIVGTGGFQPIGLQKSKTCELKNMYFLQEIRGQGLGSQFLKHVFQQAKENGYQKIYLETMDFMHSANTLYVNHGFKPLPAPLFNTGHVWTNRWYLKEL